MTSDTISSEHKKTLDRVIQYKTFTQRRLKSTPQIIKELLQLGYLERAGVNSNLMTYRLTEAGRAVTGATVEEE